MINSSRSNYPTAIFLMGPTASGKTSIAVELVKRLPVDIISVDSALIYRGMDIGTAKPDSEVLSIAPHRLINILDPHEAYSVAQFCSDALTEMKKITNNNRIPLLVGGTMLYYKALRNGLSNMPSSDPVIRKKIDEMILEHGPEYLHQRLSEVDPESAARLHPNDPQRLKRALEVYEISGIALSEFHKKSALYALEYDVIDIVIAPSDRSQLHSTIKNRFLAMLQQGFIDEVQGFYLRQDLNLEHASMRCVGYRQIWQYLDGGLSYDEMIERAIIATRQLAKRQFTWLRSVSPEDWIDSLDVDLLQKVLKKCQKSPSLLNLL